MITLWISIFIVLIAAITSWSSLYAIAVSIIFVSNIVYSMQSIKKNISFLLFHISIFTLWLARIFFEIINQETSIAQSVEYYGTKTFILIYISLISIRVGYIIMKKKLIYKSSKFKLLRKTYVNNEIIGKIALTLFLITLVPKFYTVIERASFVQSNTYIDYYKEYVRSYPSWIVLLSTMNQYSFFAFLGTTPPKKPTIIVMVLYLFSSVILLFAGIRNTLVIELLIITWYLFYREKLRNSEDSVWISKKIILIAIIAFPFFILFMELLAYIRLGTKPENANMYVLIVEFFERQSGSVEHLRNISEISSQFPEPHWRFFVQPLINLIQGNTITSKFFSFQTYTQHTVDAALYAFNYGQSYTYIIMPHNYLAGVGMGGNYAAETYLSIGYIGLILYNFFIGAFLSFSSIIIKMRWYTFAVYFSILGSILYLPREIALAWVVKGFNMNAMGTYFLIYVIASALPKRHRLIVDISEKTTT